MIAGMVGVGLVFVVLNLLLAQGPKGVRVFSAPTSLQVQRGVPQPVELLSRCAPVIDFDGSFWAPPGGWRLHAPVEPATAALVGAGHVLLRLGSGQRIRLERRSAPIRLSRCSSPSP